MTDDYYQHIGDLSRQTSILYREIEVVKCTFIWEWELLAFFWYEYNVWNILKQKSLATQNIVGILFIIKIPVLKMD